MWAGGGVKSSRYGSRKEAETKVAGGARRASLAAEAVTYPGGGSLDNGLAWGHIAPYPRVPPS